jgi:hypothetical protein
MLYNTGTEEIEKASAKVEILTQAGEKVAEVHTFDKSISSGEEAKLEAIWDPDTEGTYNAVATVYYDDMQLEIEQDFDVVTTDISTAPVVRVADEGEKEEPTGHGAIIMFVLIALSCVLFYFLSKHIRKKGGAK